MRRESWRPIEVECLDPDWDGAGKVHDWRNHVGDKVRAIWHTFTDEQKLILAQDADERASNEEWE